MLQCHIQVASAHFSYTASVASLAPLTSHRTATQSACLKLLIEHVHGVENEGYY